MSNRRDFLKKGALLGLSSVALGAFGKENLEQFEKATTLVGGAAKATLPALPYAYDALEPFIDKMTMEIHHDKHHQAYVDKLNTVPADQFDASIDLAESCKKITAMSTPLLRNNLGGHFNHSLFWTLLKPNAEKKENKPSGKLAAAIAAKFGSFENFNKEFSEKSLKLFGSGWCWLIVSKENGLQISTTPNQDNPHMPVATDKGTPVLALDVWEHAYYLKYQNKRVDYISNWWNIINWEKAEELFSKA
jgi:Fe-Mn family superoxide dismutase